MSKNKKKIKSKKDKKKEKLEKEIKKTKRRNYLFLIIIILVTFIFYGNTIRNYYSLDDHDVCFQNPTVQKGFKGIPEIFTSLYANEADLSYGYRPIVKTTYAIEYQLFGQAPHASHFINILIYLFTALLLFKILKRLLKNYNIFFPFIITILFIAHPIHTEVVASLKNRDELLSLLGCLLGLYFLIKYVDKNKIKYIVWALIFYALAILSKPSALSFLLIYPLVLYFFTDIKPKKILYLFLVVLIITFIAGYLPRLFLPKTHRPVQFFENPLYFEKNIMIKLATGFYILGFYLKLLIYPHPLLFYYGYDMVPLVNFTNIRAILSFISYLFIFVYALLKIKEKHILSFAILFYLITIATYSNIITPFPGIVADRFLFVPSFGFCLIISYFLFKLFKLNPKQLDIPNKSISKVLIVVTIILIPYAIKTINRNKNWRSYLSLYSHDIKYLRNSVKANTLYASALTEKLYYDNKNGVDISKIPQERKLVTEHYKQALKIYPENYKALNNLGSFYSNNLRQYDSSIFYLKKAVEIKPDLEEPYFNLGYAYQKLKKYDEAIKNYNKAIDINPQNVTLRSYLANLYNEMGDFEKAVKINKEIMKIDENSDLPYINIGNYYFLKADTTTAISYWEKAMGKYPQYKLCINLSNYYRLKGNSEKANYYYNKAMQAKKRNQ